MTKVTWQRVSRKWASVINCKPMKRNQKKDMLTATTVTLTALRQISLKFLTPKWPTCQSEKKITINAKKTKINAKKQTNREKSNKTTNTATQQFQTDNEADNDNQHHQRHRQRPTKTEKNPQHITKYNNNNGRNDSKTKPKNEFNTE